MKPIMFTTLAALALTTGCAHKYSKAEIETLEQGYVQMGAWYIASEMDSMAKELRIEDLEGYIAQMRQVDDAVADFYTDLFEEFEPGLRSGRISLSVSDGRLHLGVSDDVLFDTASAELSESGEDAVARLARVMKRHPDRRFQVEGHTDARPIDTEDYDSNWELGAARAVSVVETLVDNGVKGSNLSAASFAQFDPAASNSTETGRAHNRRIDVVIVPDMEELEARQALSQLASR